jgi:hypothetical protein
VISPAILSTTPSPKITLQDKLNSYIKRIPSSLHPLNHLLSIKNRGDKLLHVLPRDKELAKNSQLLANHPPSNSACNQAFVDKPLPGSSFRLHLIDVHLGI